MFEFGQKDADLIDIWYLENAKEHLFVKHRFKG
jgi:hypothetical protein